ncbi:MAG: YeeE/YedE family protein, partial [Limnohabitans sp.]
MSIALNEVIELYGEGTVLAIGGAIIGVLFGFFAQRSKFCLRAAVIDFWHGHFKDKLSIWLLAFSAAVIAT